MSKKIKLLCVGIGGYANIYMRAFFKDENPNYEIVGAVDPFAEGCESYPKLIEAKVPFYDSMEDFYRERSADLAIITTPIHFHTRQILTALENGSNVMCEKPLSGVSADAEIIEQKAKEVGKFVMIGYQWSYCKPILDLKADVISGELGAPVFFKTLILWPRKEEYFKRGSGWAGKLRASDGSIINDSVASNACAHYIHNMLFVAGEEYLSAEACEVKADLLRVNNIENFDNATIRFKLSSGGECLFVAGHSSLENVNPSFEYEFENATVKFSEDTKDIVAYFKDGRVKNYGAPDTASSPDKIFFAIKACENNGYKPVCSPHTAAAHTRCIEAVQTFPIYSVNEEFLQKKGSLIYINGFTELMKRCYNDKKMLSETEDFERLVK